MTKSSSLPSTGHTKLSQHRERRARKTPATTEAASGPEEDIMTVSQSSITSMAARGSFLRQGLKGLCSQEKTRQDTPAAPDRAPGSSPRIPAPAAGTSR